MSKKIFVVMGAIEDGIGDAVTNRIIAEGHKVIGSYEPEKSEKAKNLENNSNLELYEVDHSSRKSLVNFTETLKDKKIDGIINAQMAFEMENVNNFSQDLWEKLIYVNLTMPNLITHELKKNLSQEGSIVFVTSTEGFMGSFGASAYASTKAALHNLIKTHANNLGSRGIRINAVVPGWIGGVMDTDDVFNMSRKITPLGRLGAPEEVASACWFLLSDQATFITGTTLVVDGGYSGVDTISKFEFEAENS